MMRVVKGEDMRWVEREMDGWEDGDKVVIGSKRRGEWKGFNE